MIYVTPAIVYCWYGYMVKDSKWIYVFDNNWEHDIYKQFALSIHIIAQSNW